MAKKQEGIPHNHILEIILMNPKIVYIFTSLHKECPILLHAILYSVLWCQEVDFKSNNLCQNINKNFSKRKIF